MSSTDHQILLGFDVSSFWPLCPFSPCSSIALGISTFLFGNPSWPTGYAYCDLTSQHVCLHFDKLGSVPWCREGQALEGKDDWIQLSRGVVCMGCFWVSVSGYICVCVSLHVFVFSCICLIWYLVGGEKLLCFRYALSIKNTVGSLRADKNLFWTFEPEVYARSNMAWPVFGSNNISAHVLKHC